MYLISTENKVSLDCMSVSEINITIKVPLVDCNHAFDFSKKRGANCKTVRVLSMNRDVSPGGSRSPSLSVAV